MHDQNAYILHNLHNWPQIRLGNFILKVCLFGANFIGKKGKSKYVYSGNGIAFDVKSEWNFGNESASNVVTFGVDNNPTSQIIAKIIFWCLMKEILFVLMEVLVHQTKISKLILVNQSHKFAWFCITLMIIVICL